MYAWPMSERNNKINIAMVGNAYMRRFKVLSPIDFNRLFKHVPIETDETWMGIILGSQSMCMSSHVVLRCNLYKNSEYILLFLCYSQGPEAEECLVLGLLVVNA